jgi:hypothetical protein
MASQCEWLSLSLANGGASTNLGLKVLRVQEKGGGGGEPTPGIGPGRPAHAARNGPGRPAHLGPVRSPLRSCGFSCIYALCPLHLHYFDDDILTSKMEVLLA